MEDVSKQRILEDKLKNYAEELEQKVGERTAELGRRVGQLEDMSDMTQMRERMVLELQEQVRVLTKKLEEALSTIGK